MYKQGVSVFSREAVEDKSLHFRTFSVALDNRRSGWCVWRKLSPFFRALWRYIDTYEHLVVTPTPPLRGHDTGIRFQVPQVPHAGHLAFALAMTILSRISPFARDFPSRAVRTLRTTRASIPCHRLTCLEIPHAPKAKGSCGNYIYIQHAFAKASMPQANHFSLICDCLRLRLRVRFFVAPLARACVFLSLRYGRDRRARQPEGDHRDSRSGGAGRGDSPGKPRGVLFTPLPAATSIGGAPSHSHAPAMRPSSDRASLYETRLQDLTCVFLTPFPALFVLDEASPPFPTRPKFQWACRYQT